MKKKTPNIKFHMACGNEPTNFFFIINKFLKNTEHMYYILKAVISLTFLMFFLFIINKNLNYVFSQLAQF